jgi:GDPmannose 4,6-dehydratase
LPTALITGITGQDGAYLSQLLLEKGYRVIGLLRRSASAEVIGERLRWLGIDRDVEMRDGDLLDLSSLVRVVGDTAPEEIYNLAAQSFVATSWHQPLLTGTVTGMGAVAVLEAVRMAHPSTRFYQASSSEMFGKVQEASQSEKTAFYPRSRRCQTNGGSSTSSATAISRAAIYAARARHSAKAAERLRL